MKEAISNFLCAAGDDAKSVSKTEEEVCPFSRSSPDRNGEPARTFDPESEAARDGRNADIISRKVAFDLLVLRGGVWWSFKANL